MDTNVLIAAFIARGVCHQLLEHCVRQHELVTSDFIITEFREKLTGKFKYAPEEAEEAAGLLLSVMEVVDPADLQAAVCRDPDDDKILGTAVSGACSCIVTGDNDLLVLKQFRGIDILKPADFQHYESSQ